MFLKFNTDKQGIEITKAIIEFMRKNYSFAYCNIINYEGLGRNIKMMTIFNRIDDMYISFKHGLTYCVYSFDKIAKKKC